MNETKKIKVLCILSGFGRSGSTLLTSILSQVEGIHSLGETSFLPREAANPITLCTCGKKTPDCDYWGNIIAGFSDFEKSEWANLKRIIENQTRTRWLLFGNPKHTQFRRKKNQLRGYLKRLILAVAEKGQGELLVEDSKNALYVKLLSEIKEIDLYCIQLIRDPRAVCYSWTRMVKLNPDSEREMPRFSPLKVALFWTLWNIAGLKLFGNDKNHFALLRYEDFVQAPVKSLRNISQFVGENFNTNPWLTDQSYQLTKERHFFAGNPNRFESGTIPLRLDDKWLKRMSKWQQKWVKMIGSIYFHLENSSKYKNVPRL